MKPIQYRNRRPIEYHPNDFRKTLRTKRFYDHVHLSHWKPRKWPGIFVGAAGLVLLVAGELIQGSFGIAIVFFSFFLIAVGSHFEILNRLVRQYKYFIVPSVAVLITILFLIRPQIFGVLLPKENISELYHFSSGFVFNPDELTVNFGGGGASIKYTRKQLEQAKGDSDELTRSEVPFRAYLDSGKLFFDANIFAGADQTPIHMRRNVFGGLPFRWDGNFNSNSLEVVNADTMPVFQLLFTSGDNVRVNGVFQSHGKLIIADEGGVSVAQAKRVLFYGAKPIFKYPSWKFKGVRAPL